MTGTPLSDACVMPHGTDDNGRPNLRRRDIGYLCNGHRKRMDGLTDEIRELLIDLVQITESNSAPADETPKTRRTKAAEAPAPANLEALALLDRRTHPLHMPPNPSIAKHEGDTSNPIDAVLYKIASWLSLVIEERNLTETWHRVVIRANRAVRIGVYTALIREPRSVMAQLAMLARHHDWMAAQAWVDDYLIEMADAQDALRHALNDQPWRRIGRCRLPAPNDGEGQCGGALLQENGSGVVRCTDCRATWVTAQEHARLALTLDSA